MREYFGWPAYWDTVVDKVFPPNLIPAGRNSGHTKEDNHLRSWEDVIGYEVWASTMAWSGIWRASLWMRPSGISVTSM